MKKVFKLLFLFSIIESSSVRSAEDPFIKAEEYFKKGKFEMALVFYNKTLESKPDNHIALFNRGRIHIYNKNYSSAVADFKKVLEINNKRTDVYYYLGCAEAASGNTESAINFFLKVPSKDKNYASSFLNLGNIYLSKLHDKTQTIENWEKFLSLRPDDEQADRIREAIRCLKDPDCWNSVLSALTSSSTSDFNSSSSNVSENTNKTLLPDFLMPDIRGEGTKADVSKQKSIEDKKSIKTE